MTKVKIELEIDAIQVEQTQALYNLMRAIGGQPSNLVATLEVPKEELTKSEPKEDKPKRKRRTKAEIEAEEKTKKAEEDKNLLGDEEQEEPEITLKDLKKRLGGFIEKENGDDYRDQAREKLNELGGAERLSDLDEKHYPEFMDFLNSLDD